ncbi:MarC family protein [Brevibacillus ginsengisoli]|uniref:MarC family protein n=1 Tax=Brevibacillus ginsengisoli TaxID=363854 RepID=UPI003CF4B655
MHAELSFALLCFTSFLTLINPLGVMPVFMTMVSDYDNAVIKATARKALMVSFLTLLVFAFTGQLLFKFFGISVNSLKIVGGVIFFFMGQEMLQARLVKTKVAEPELKKYVNDISITPLAIPMICGPGAITNSIVLMENAHNLIEKGILVLSILFICVLTYVVLLNSSRLMRILGETGNTVLMRLMGLIVMVIAVEFFLGGLKPYLLDILSHLPKA